MGANAAWRVTGFLLRVSSWAFIWLVSRTTGESRVRQNSRRFGMLDFILDGYFRVQICES